MSERHDHIHTLNVFTRKYLRGVPHLHYDASDRALNSRTLLVKYELGYGKDRDASWKSLTVRRVRHPHSRKYSSARMRAAGAKRRSAQRAAHRLHVLHATVAPGVGRFDGVPVAKWMIPYLQWARDSGRWHGVLRSGWRARWYSRLLCIRICGRPRCPGTCAGESSRHVGDARPNGAVDVSDPAGFGDAMRHCPYSPRLWNNLSRDRVHYSAFGN